MKHLTVTMAAAGMILIAGAAQQGVPDATANTYTITVAANATVTLNGDDVTALGTGVTLVKEGEGRLIIATDLKAEGYDGEIQVKAGYLQPQNNGALGGTGKGTVISSSGATLEIYSTTSGYMYPGEPITVGGNGVGGHGAIYCVKGGSGVANRQMLQCPVTFTADTKLGYDGDDSSVRGGCIFGTASGQKFDMGGHTLTFVKRATDAASILSGFSRINDGSFSNHGHVVVGENVGFVFENYFLLRGSSANTFTLKEGASINSISSYQKAFAWTLIVDGDASMSQWGANVYDNLGWGGPVTLNATLTVSAPKSTFSGKFSGTGALVYGTTAIVNGDSSRTNTYTGGTTFKKGCNVTFAAPELVPTAGPVAVGSGVKLLFRPANSDDTSFFTDQSVTSLTRLLMPYVDRASEVYIYGIDSTWPESFTDSLPVDGTASPVTYSGFLTNAVGRFTGTMSGFVDVKVRPKTLMSIDTDAATEGYVEVNGGTLTVPKDVTLTVSNKVFVGGADASHVGRLKIEGTLDLIHATKSMQAVVASSQVLSGNVRSTERGVVEVASGGTVNGYFGPQQGGCTNAASQSSGSAGIYSVKGTVNANVSEAFVGDFRSEYLEIAAGGLLNSGSMRTGRGSGSYGHLRVMSGGTVSASEASFQLAHNGGASDILIDGGRFIAPDSGLYMNRAERDQTAGYTSLTVCDNGELRLPNTASGMGWQPFQVNNCNASTAYLNLNDGGFLESSPIMRASEFGSFIRSGNRSVVSFNGGIYAMRYNSESRYQNQKCFDNFETGEGTAGDHVFVFAKGATISNVTPTYVGFPMEAPTGKGIESIALPNEIANMAAWAIHGAPMVLITDTTGYGATAVAIYDSASGKVTAVRVTSRGVNYTSPTITFSKAGLSSAKSYTGCCTLTDNVSGGLTKTGSGTLTVNVTNTYAGVTTVRQGTLKLGCDNVLDSSGGIVVESGATLDLNGKASSPAISGFGRIVGDATLPADWTIDGAELAAAATSFTATGTVTIPDGATLTLVHPECLDAAKRYVVAEAGGTLAGDVPSLVCPSGGRWTLVKHGKKLILKRPRGLAILFR